jgi:beta-catenin-like protein 1
MPATPDLQFFDKYKEASDAMDQTESIGSGEHSSKKRNIEEDEDEDDSEYTERYQDDEAEFEDEEGRFFGGGLTNEQSSILDLVDEYDVDEVYMIVFDINAVEI